MDDEDTVNIKDILDIWNNYIKEHLFNGKLTVDLDLKKYYFLLGEAEKGNLLHWLSHKEGFMAHIILTFYFSKNIYKEIDQFKNDKKTILFMEMGIENYIDTLDINELITILSPYVNSEDKTMVSLAYNTISTFLEKDIDVSSKFYSKVKKYLFLINRKIKVLQKFNRYPERNYILERVSTEEEIDYLDKNF